MSRVINLRQARKQLKRREKAQKAAENRALFGQSKADRRLRLDQEEQAENRHSNHRRDDAGANQRVEDSD